MNDSILLEKYRDSLKVAWGYNDYNDWPIRISSIMHLFADAFAEEFVSDLNMIWDRTEDAAEIIGKAFKFPGRIFRLIDVVLFGLRRKRIPLSEQHQFIFKMIKIAETLKLSDTFSELGTNLLKGTHIPTELDRINSNVVHRLQAALFAYTEATLFRGHDATKSVHGPYTDDNSCFIFREYYNLRPTELWERKLLLPVESIRTICNYNSDVEVRVDNFDHIYHEGILGKSLIGSVIEINGVREKNDQVIIELTDEIIQKARAVAAIVDRWEWRQKAEKYAEIFWIRKYPLSNLCGRTKSPPSHVYHQILQGNINKVRQKCLSPDEVAKLIRLVL
ncbi:hypothetical protein [Paenibacillus agilis]|uniref:Uncharacterized protein n=1 Tax=Paenibacillus agilis TaxID=3020863 RepID=A0A559J103_9BACL|nr:hypothetical protein [Paenibacillus agilis]TVX93564.1 hypothetical protein FPZ44_11165 [Paenibacillus agilis]